MWTRSTKSLGADEIFTALAIVALVSGPLDNLIACLPFWAAGYAAVLRIQNFLLLEETPTFCESVNNTAVARREPIGSSTPLDGIDQSTAESVEMASLSAPQDAVEITDLTISFGTETPILNNITLKIPKSCTAMAYGPVGCGKSTFLRAIIREVESAQGTVRTITKSIAYCDQSTWLQNVTIRENIQGDGGFESEWYWKVVKACCLDKDFEQLSAADQALVGSEGCNLSGGQKQRIVSCPVDAFTNSKKLTSHRHLLERCTLNLRF